MTTLTTEARNATPWDEEKPSLSREIVLNTATRVDKFEALHAMAVTCKAWNNVLQDVFVWLKAIAGADDKTSGRMLKHEHALMPKAKAIDFALSWLKSRLSKHRAEEKPETINLFVRGAITLLVRQRNKTGIARWSAQPEPSPSGGIFLTIFNSIEKEIGDEQQRNAFRTAVFAQRRAIYVFGTECATREWQRCREFADDDNLLLASLHDQVLCDAVFRIMAIKIGTGHQSIDRLNAILDQVPVEAILRWLDIKDVLIPDCPVKYSLVDHVLDTREITRGSGKILARFIEPLFKERFRRFITIDRDPVKYANFVEITFSNEELLKSLVERSEKVLSRRYLGEIDEEDAQLATNFLQLVLGSERGITVETIAAWCDEAERNWYTLYSKDLDRLGTEGDPGPEYDPGPENGLGWTHSPGSEDEAGSGDVV